MNEKKILATHTVALASLFIIFALLHTTFASAFLVSPGRVVFETSGVHEFTVTAREVNGLVSVRAQGDLAQYVTFDKTTADANGQAQFKGVIQIPDDIEPGDHPQDIIVTYAAGAGDVISANVELASQVIARKAYTGPYLVADVYASPDGGRTDATNVYITVENRGIAAVTPQVSLKRGGGAIVVLPDQELGSQSVTRYTSTVIGHGEETITLFISGANELQKTFVATIGQPTIVLFTATAQPDGGAITPLDIRAVIDWNKPISATLIIDGKEQSVTIDEELSARYYTESNAQVIPVTLRVGRMESTAQVVLRGAQAQKHEGIPTWAWVALAVVLFVLVNVFFWYRSRSRV